MDALDEALGRADHVCLTVPMTPATHRGSPAWVSAALAEARAAQPIS
jgi:hypothetical protein